MIYIVYDCIFNVLQEIVQFGEMLFVGMDFNVGKMVVVVYVKCLGLLYVVDEIVNGYDILDMICQIKEWFWLYVDGEYCFICQIRIYFDVFGDLCKLVWVSEIDIVLFKQVGFIVLVFIVNLLVKDWINFMNVMFCNVKGEWWYWVNFDCCLIYVDVFEQQVWGINGELDKFVDIDYFNDVVGYFIYKEFLVE